MGLRRVACSDRVWWRALSMTSESAIEIIFQTRICIGLGMIEDADWSTPSALGEDPQYFEIKFALSDRQNFLSGGIAFPGHSIENKNEEMIFYFFEDHREPIDLGVAVRQIVNQFNIAESIALKPLDEGQLILRFPKRTKAKIANLK